MTPYLPVIERGHEDLQIDRIKMSEGRLELPTSGL